MFHGSAHTRPFQVAASTVDGKYGASSSGATHGERSSSQPARANSGTQMTSSIMHVEAGAPPLEVDHVELVLLVARPRQRLALHAHAGMARARTRGAARGRDRRDRGSGRA